MTGREGPAFRLSLVKWACLVSACVLVARLVQVQVVQHERHRIAADKLWLDAEVIEPHRGNLFDRQGRPLALTVSSHRVSVIGSQVNRPDSVSAVLAEVLAADRADMARRVAAAGKRYVTIEPQAFLTEAQKRRLKRFAGVEIIDQLGRVYPLDGVGASLIGFYREDPDRTRRCTGLELGLDSLLVGEPGRSMKVCSARLGQDYGDVVVEPVRHGADVVLTIDADLQEICESRLRDAVAVCDAAAGSVLVLDPRNGDILAAASYPLVETRERPVRDVACWINRNLTTAFEPGSVFKIFTAATLLARGVVDTATVFDCSDNRFGGYTIDEAAGHHYGRLDFMEAFSQSSNVWFARAATNLSREEQYRALVDFGFGKLTGLPYPAERAGILAVPTAWSARSQPTIAIGQEVAVSPLQLGLAVAAVANGGTLFAPRIYCEVRSGPGAAAQHVEPEPLRSVLPRGLDAVLREAMRRVVREGTGAAVERDWIAIGGKTGTGQKSVPGRGYRDNLHVATFVGLLPVAAPRLVIVAVLDEPSWSKHYAAQSAAPLFGAVVDDIRRTTDWLTDVDLTCERRVIGPDRQALPVPDVMFLTSAGAVRRLESAGFTVRGAEPEGRVIMQVPAAGSLLAPGQTVALTVRARAGDTPQACPDVRGLSNREIQALAARLGVPVEVAGVGYVADQEPAPGVDLTADGLRVRMTNTWQ
ncbi:MAG TPA: penicillin-binding transpeptidase domain-containing protein [Candidatus Krumholzibacteria bacterium]|nr:penicillin-binding transpeptidase domain-containing protein [Candidatus Krumholzibacteria bacterium]HPD72779.1 penicillin-binding transpeptidase domain-containing protein [Candidatus Krumholzibacteria bacterium]HRY40289.1 penicillin-binding transpeptidase domain-containing protein [Candidatus Krumholzibacteria bacterium]